ncbi:hypothetical protein NUW54_g5652 [Trametes sanguinea]|uniref:Uncharacterized protein n=1 Tax=Trametes sanguinea TaxID=158606 RepID=A0ACC1PWC8_9APHY|nr:hypothetical protein NUW54_g5652 [Trametes sanguinea]
MQNEKRTHLYFPAHVNSNHWVTFEVDFEKRTLTYGDSLHHRGSTISARTRSSILAWLKADFGGRWIDGGYNLAIGTQRDNTSCGVYAENAIAHRIFGDPLIEHGTQDRERMDLFIAIVRAHNDLESRMERHRQEHPAILSESAYDDLSIEDLELRNDHNFTREEHSTLTSRHPDGTTHLLVTDATAQIKSTVRVPAPLAALSSKATSSLSAPTGVLSMKLNSASCPESGTNSSSADHLPSKRPLSLVSESDSDVELAAGDNESCSSSGASTTEEARSRHQTRSKGGQSRSAQASRQLRALVKSGRFVPDENKVATFREKIRSLDPFADIDIKHWKVYHSACSKWYKMSEPYNTAKFTDHITKRCRVTATTAACAKPRLKKQKILGEGDKRQDGTIHAFFSRRNATDPEGRNTPQAKPEAIANSQCSSGASLDGHSSQPSVSGSEKSLPPVAKKAVSTTITFWTSKLNLKKRKSLGGTNNEPRLRPATPSPAQKPTAASTPTVPCGGITEMHEQRLPQYLWRPSADGGGSKKRDVFIQELWPDEERNWSDLDSDEQEQVNLVQKHHRTWRIDRENARVFATACLKSVALDNFSGSTDGPPPICAECRVVLSSKQFDNACRRTVKDKKNFKFANKQYTNQKLAEIYARCKGLEALIEDPDAETSVFTRFAVGVQNGEFTKDDVLLDLVRALVEKAEREKRGKGLQNFRYGAALWDFAQTCAITGRRVYDILGKHFQVPAIRTLKREQARQPQFPLSVEECTFEMAEAYVKRLGYQGPVSLSCDDTKLQPAFRVVYDRAKDTDFLIGGIDGPLEVANPDELRKLLDALPKTKKAQKIRLWTLQAPYPGIPPLILAARAIPNNLKAPELYAYLMQIINGLAAKDIHVVSYACDGTETERAVQRLVVEHATSCRTHSIKRPRPGAPDVVLTIAEIHGRPLVMIQDSKHAAKTFRNNLFSGARALVLGNFLAVYHYARDIAFHALGPLFHRDVEKLDRQDDNAATRLFASATLDFTATTYPDRVGLIVYLFIFGELIDAYQSRSISHLERAHMVLRASYFLTTWRRFLSVAGYSEDRYCLSREAIDITGYLIEGLLGLIYVFRDLGDYPLVPWLHSTEVVEHLFAEMRKLVKDFTFEDWLFNARKLQTLVRTVNKGRDNSDPKARAQGYAHTYMDYRGIDLASLAVFPTDKELDKAAESAWNDTINLMEVLGVDITTLHTAASSSDTRSVPQGPEAIRLPSINSWYPPQPSSSTASARHDTMVASQPAHFAQEDEELPDGDDSDESVFELTEQAQLEELIEYEDGILRNTTTGRQVQRRLFQLQCAAAAVTLDEKCRPRGEDDEQHDEDDSTLAEGEAETVHEILDSTRRRRSSAHPYIELPELDWPEEKAAVFDAVPSVHGRTDFSLLIKIREMHETERAKKAIRRRNTPQSSDSHAEIILCEDSAGQQASAKPTVSTRGQILSSMHAILREAGEYAKGTGSGLERQARISGSTSVELAGNAANALLAAGQRALKIVEWRGKLFTKFRVPQSALLTDALVGTPHPSRRDHRRLQAGVWGIVYHAGHLFLVDVVCVYSQNAAKGSPHAWREGVDSIGLVSYIVVQAYERSPGMNRFRPVHDRVVTLQTVSYLHVPSEHFLRTLPGSDPSFSLDRKAVRLNNEAYEVFCTLDEDSAVRERIQAAVKALDAARKRGEATEAATATAAKAGTQ